MNKSSTDFFPLVFGSLLIIAVVSFTAFTLFVVVGKWKDNHKSNEDDGVHDSTSERKTAATFLNSYAVGDEGDLENSWIYGGSDGEEELDMVEEVGEEVIMSWSDLSCSYQSKKGEDDIKTLSLVTGHIRYTELVAIMVCLYSDYFTTSRVLFRFFIIDKYLLTDMSLFCLDREVAAEASQH